MNDKSDGGPADSIIRSDADMPVTTVIVHRPRKDAVAAYEDWLKLIMAVAERAPGHRGVNVIPPHGGSGAYTIVLHFDCINNLRRWLDSRTRARLAEDIRPYLDTEEQIEIRSGVEFWFTPPATGRTAPPWKQFLVTLSAIYPLTVAVPWLLEPLVRRVPVLGVTGVHHFIVAALVVALMIWLVMPRYTRLVSRWLYRAPGKAG